MEKYLVIILLILLVYTLYQCWNLTSVRTEGFAEVATNPDTNSSIATLAQVATALQKDGLTVPGSLTALNDVWVRKNPSESDKFAVRVGGMYNGGGICSSGGSPLELFSENKEVYIGSTNGSAPKNNLNVTGTLSANNARINKFYKASGGSSDGIEFLHDNGSQGIGLGFNTIYAAGTLADINLGLQAKGSGIVHINNRNILAELDALRAANAALRADLDDRTTEVFSRNHMPKGYVFGEGGTAILRDGWARWARRG